MRNFDKQRGASMPLVVLFIAMTSIILTIAFKLYPAYYEHWLIEAVMESLEKDSKIESMSINALENNFETRLLTNNVREFDVSEGFFAEKTDNSVYLAVEYEVRIPMYSNIDAVLKFEESFEKKF